MANIKNFGLAGIGSDVQFGKGGGRLIYDSSSSFFKFTTDGSTLAQIRVATTPSDANDVASKSYVDGAVTGLDVKQSVRAATTAAGTLASDFENGDTIDGVTLATGDRILIKDQATGSENGVYTVNASGAPTRATDFDADSEVTAGAFFFVEEGTTNADSGFVLSTNDDITVGSTALTFTQFSGTGQIVAGDGLDKSGSTLSVNVDDSTLEISSDTLQIKSDYAGQTSIDTLGTVTTGTWNATDIGVAHGGTGASTAADARTNLGLVIGTDVQAYDAQLADIAGLTPTDGNIIVGDGTNFVAESGATARASLGLTIGTDVQAYDAQLADIAGLTPTDGNIIVGDGSNFVAESGATARTSLGLGTGDTPTFNGAAMGSAAITGVADPSNAQDAATKAYVDGLVGAGSITQALGADTGSGTVSLGSQTLTVSGTSNAITTSASGQAITIDIADNPTFTGNATITGNLTVQGTTTTVNSTEITIQNAFTFEGATADAFETTLTVVDPTADRTITLPNASGTVVLEDTAQTLTNKTIDFANNTISGQLSLANGGTGLDLSAIAQGTILVAGAGNTLGSLTIGDANKYLRSTGTTASYDYVTALRDNTDGNVVIEADTANIADNTKLQIRNTSSNVSIHAIDPDDATANVNLVLESQGTGGRVLIRDASGGSSVIIGDDDSSLTVSGGASSSSDAGDIVIKGGNGTSSNASGDAIIKGGTGGSAEGKVKITDSSDNEIAIFERTASAVNEFTFTNNATGSNPSMAATGDDTNISIQLTPKGNGLVIVPDGYESDVGTNDDALVTRKWVLDNVVTATDDLTIRAALTNGNASETVGTMPNASSTTYYVTRIAINTTVAYAGGSVDSMQITDGTTVLATVNESDVTTTGSYIVDLDGATATAGGATLTLQFKQSDGTTAATPTSGAMTVFVEYKATT